MKIDLDISHIISIVTLLGSWMLWTTNKLRKIDFSVKYINKNLYFVDWDKVPTKNLNHIFNKEDQKP